uniref:CW domain-containing protein n=1 Tax=Caenorhabditis japonica TaxID=281687 RepID=A0A8R1HP91_CAEJA
MIKIFGTVQGADLTSGTILSIEDCIDDCLSSEECILAYMDTDNHCLNIQYNNVEKIEVEEGSSENKQKYVAFKA